jgi:hypothetical protein
MSESLPESTSTPPGPEVTLEALAHAHQSLRSAFHVTLVMMVILAGSLFVFFLREVSIARRQIAELTQVVADYEKNAVPLMEDFRAKLQVFARSHPDFVPIYTRYFGTNPAPAAASLPAASLPAVPVQSPAKAQAAPGNPPGARLPPK